MFIITYLIGSKISAKIISAEISKARIIINNGIDIIRPIIICLITLFSFYLFIFYICYVSFLLK